MLRRNKPTVAELKSLYESEMYQNLLHEFAKRSNRELDNNEDDQSELLRRLTWLRKCYALLDAPFEEILSEFKRSKDLFFDYLIARLKKRSNDRIALPIVSKIDKTYLLECFCDFYMVLTAIRQKSTTRRSTARKCSEKENRQRCQPLTSGFAKAGQWLVDKVVRK